MNKLEMYIEIMKKMYTTYVNKNNDYGDSFGKSIEKYGFISGLTRISDKFNRLETIILNDCNYNVEDETLKDTLIDLANYCILMGIEIEKIEGGDFPF